MNLSYFKIYFITMSLQENKDTNFKYFNQKNHRE